MRKRKTLWHNYRAFQSPKMQALIAKYGLKFYGYYWLLIEIAARNDLQIIKNKFNALMIARDFGVDVLEVESIMHIFKEMELFDELDDAYYAVLDDSLFRFI